MLPIWIRAIPLVEGVYSKHSTMAATARLGRAKYSVFWQPNPIHPLVRDVKTGQFLAVMIVNFSSWPHSSGGFDAVEYNLTSLLFAIPRTSLKGCRRELAGRRVKTISLSLQGAELVDGNKGPRAGASTRPHSIKAKPLGCIPSSLVCPFCPVPAGDVSNLSELGL